MFPEDGEPGWQADGMADGGAHRYGHPSSNDGPSGCSQIRRREGSENQPVAYLPVPTGTAVYRAPRHWLITGFLCSRRSKQHLIGEGLPSLGQLPFNGMLRDRGGGGGRTGGQHTVRLPNHVRAGSWRTSTGCEDRSERKKSNRRFSGMKNSVTTQARRRAIARRQLRWHSGTTYRSGLPR